MLIAGCGGEKQYNCLIQVYCIINANDFGLFILVKYALATCMYRIVFLSFLFSLMVPPPKQHEILQLYVKDIKKLHFCCKSRMPTYLIEEMVERKHKRYCKNQENGFRKYILFLFFFGPFGNCPIFCMNDLIFEAVSVFCG